MLFVQAAKKFRANITIVNTKNSQRANAKSIVEVLSLGADYGDEVIISAEGPDKEIAITGLLNLINKLREEDSNQERIASIVLSIFLSSSGICLFKPGEMSSETVYGSSTSMPTK